MRHHAITTLVFHPDDEASKVVATALCEQFDRLGMERAGIHMRIPVRFRSKPFTADGRLKPLAFKAATLDTVVVLESDELTEEPGAFAALFEALPDTPEGARDPLIIPVAMEPNATSITPDPNRQMVRWRDWKEMGLKARVRRLLIHIVNSMRRAILQPEQREPVFISHAKRDGLKAAERVIRHMSDPANGLTLDAFYDAKHLEISENFRIGLEDAASRGSLLALVSNAYDTRPYCNEEVIWAKRARRPIVTVDVGRTRIGRSFPYAGNVPLFANPLKTADDIEAALLELLAEALRCDIFSLVASDITASQTEIFPRPPELLDLIFADKGAAAPTIVYPDPPLPDFEVQILRAAFGGRPITTVGDLS